MGVVNVTPDSFSDGGSFARSPAAVEHALLLLDEGADWVDVGGESTRPGAAPVDEREEIERTARVIAGIVQARPAAIVSIDTTKAAVAQAAVEAGARIVNDVSALDDPAMAEVAARSRSTLVLVHRRGTPETMQRDTRYDDLVGEVESFLRDRAERAVRAGVSREDIVLDPGIGFGKAFADNPKLVAAVPRLRRLGYRVLVGASRKAFIGKLTGVERARDRVFGSVGAALAAAAAGADVLRVHDVRATREALAVFLACRGEG
jgi:dihydropteroate synthase